MNVNYIRKLIRLVEESDIDTLEVSSWGRTVRITHKSAANSNGHAATPVVVSTSQQPAPAQPAAAPVAAGPAPTAPPAAEVTPSDRLVEITSPMVGTFYAAPSPDADPYVSLNEKISAGQVVCIVEAMKLMNEIESEVAGRVVEICVENAQPVEFGQVLFRIDPEG
ncbi:MAG: acetyl-CoA carboxylase biotin carboxyl carrier protein [Candidatus Zixiibacteriota bacterium]|nr:MAG: acetyl-CoA carboxylase biotin carboxyl carrier protein [candidate division Zixibacteria bacterium]